MVLESLLIVSLADDTDFSITLVFISILQKFKKKNKREFHACKSYILYTSVYVANIAM